MPRGGAHDAPQLCPYANPTSADVSTGHGACVMERRMRVGDAETELLNLVDTPLAFLAPDALRPGREVLDAVMEEHR